MTKTFKILCHTIAGLVILQAAFIAWGFFGVADWITNEGGVVNKEYLECEGDCDQEFFAEWGFAFHMFFVGFVLIPLLSLITFIVSFFAKIPGAWKWGGGIFLLVVLQAMVLPVLSDEIDPIFGALHGINAFVILGTALLAGNRAKAYMSTSTDVPVAA